MATVAGDDGITTLRLVASRVACSPAGERTNSASSKKRRSRASALLTAGCDIASCHPASVTEPVRCTAHNTRSRFRSSWRKFIDPSVW